VLGRSGFGSVAAGGLLSLPGMMCTCCAAPVVAGLRARHASPGGAVAFWLGNTVLNPAALVFMGFVLGWQWSALRLVLGVAMVFGIGYLLNRIARPEDRSIDDAQLAALAAEQAAAGNPFVRWVKLLARMAVRLVPEYIVLVLLLGAARAWLFPHIGPDIGNHLGWIVAFAVAGTLFVIPTAGEVPIIQAMLSLGMGVGLGRRAADDAAADRRAVARDARALVQAVHAGDRLGARRRVRGRAGCSRSVRVLTAAGAVLADARRAVAVTAVAARDSRRRGPASRPCACSDMPAGAPPAPRIHLAPPLHACGALYKKQTGKRMTQPKIHPRLEKALTRGDLAIRQANSARATAVLNALGTMIIEASATIASKRASRFRTAIVTTTRSTACGRRRCWCRSTVR
jgi:hypothetical protein